MKRYIKITLLAILAIILVGVCVIGGLVLKNYLQDKMNPAFEETTIFPDNKFNPTDTVLTVNGIDVKMVGIRSGKVCCEGLRDTIELQDFYIAETEVTQKLWTFIFRHILNGFMPPIWENVILTKHIEAERHSVMLHGGKTTLRKRRILSKRKNQTLLAYTTCREMYLNGQSAVLTLFSM